MVMFGRHGLYVARKSLSFNKSSESERWRERERERDEKFDVYL
jgi:hypothetical protein